MISHARPETMASSPCNNENLRSSIAGGDQTDLESEAAQAAFSRTEKLKMTQLSKMQQQYAKTPIIEHDKSKQAQLQ